MAHVTLNGAEVDPRFEQMRGIGMPTLIVTLLIIRRWPRFCYSHHPFFGQTVEIVRWLRRQTSESLVVKLPDGVQIAMAAWMLAPLACRQLQDAPTPRVSVDALLALRDVLDHSLLLHPTSSRYVLGITTARSA